MINEERVKQMTKMAMFEEKQGRKYQIALHYSKKDFVTLNSLIGLAAGTLFFMLAYGILTMTLFSTVINNLSYGVVVILILVGLVLYTGYIYLYLRAIRRYAGKQYRESKELLKSIQKDYQKLEEMYELEEHEKAPEGWD